MECSGSLSVLLGIHEACRLPKNLVVPNCTSTVESHESRNGAINSISYYVPEAFPIRLSIRLHYVPWDKPTQLQNQHQTKIKTKINTKINTKHSNTPSRASWVL